MSAAANTGAKGQSAPERRPLQPLLHDLLTCVLGRTMALSSPGGHILPGGVEGFYADDVRLLDQLVVDLDGTELEPVSAGLVDASRTAFQLVARGLGDDQPDPTVWLTIDRWVDGDRMYQCLRMTSTARQPVRTTLRVRFASDLAPLGEVRRGCQGQPVEMLPLADGTGLEWSGDTAGVVRAVAEPAATRLTDGTMEWDVKLGTGDTHEVLIRCGQEEEAVVPRGGRTPEPSPPSPAEDPWGRVSVRSDTSDFAHLVHRGVGDLRSLLRADPVEPRDHYLAAGSPWYLTLFGRDSLWAARMLLPLGTGIALRTLRVLARRQGTRTDPRTAEQPGKILHELRRPGTGHDLPPVYYGTSDATSLWIVLLGEAWRWGAPREEIAALLPNLRRALEWLDRYADANGDGFVDYREVDGLGAVNQGWKDSRDSIHDAGGTLAPGPITLCEVQAYACQAAHTAAALLDDFGQSDADHWRAYAERLSDAFRRTFWTRPAAGVSYPALALDGDGRLADALTSNLGHLLGTGLLNETEAGQVAELLTGPDMLSDFGLRTLTTRSPRYNPISYHNGSVWPHDTAIAVSGMAREGLGDMAAPLARAIVAAAPVFDYRLPELWGGDALPGGRAPLVYPAACRPQAWSAAAGVALLTATLGLDVDAPRRRVTVNPMREQPFGALSVHGLYAAGQPLSLSVDRYGRLTEISAPDGFTVEDRSA